MPEEITKTNAPTRKTVAATGGAAVAGPISILVLYLFGTETPLPDHIAAAITTLITVVLTGGSGWFFAPGADEATAVVDGEIVSARRTRRVAQPA